MSNEPFISLTVSLTEEEYLALGSEMVCCKTWLSNFAHERARICMEDIVAKFVNYALQNELSIPQTKLDIIKLAYRSDLVKNHYQL
jgi:hypothetical protein